jgi:DNA repair exonuclease SbcCD nuclease subunit
MGIVTWAVGDGATGWETSKAVAGMILADKPDKFIYLGDVYDSGQPSEYRDRYDTVFGALRPVTSPIPGNHDYLSGLSGWRSYWGDHPTYFSFEIKDWRFICLDSEADHSPFSLQYRWFMSQVDTSKPTVLAFHRHRYSAGGHGDQPDVEPFVSPFRGTRAVALSGHSHVYQRIVFDNMTQFVVGSCGQGCTPCGQRPGLAYWCCDMGALRMDVDYGTIRFEYRTPQGNKLDGGAITY